MEQPIAREPVEGLVDAGAHNLVVGRQPRLRPDAVLEVQFWNRPGGVEAALLQASADAVERFLRRELGTSSGPASNTRITGDQRGLRLG